jgi:hypothetical protein
MAIARSDVADFAKSVQPPDFPNAKKPADACASAGFKFW